MNVKKTTLSTALALAVGGAAFAGTANAALTSSATLSFTLGTAETISCNYGTTPPCNKTTYATTDIVGSWFAMDNGDGVATPGEKTPIGSLNGIHIGTTQAASGSHTGDINGSENPNIDNAWTFFGGTGMHQTTSAVSASGTGSIKTLDMSGWNVVWNGIASIPLVPQGDVTITCDQSSCSDTSNYTIDGAFHVSGGGFTTVTYFLNLEGQVDGGSTPPEIPIPAAVWLFGSGLLGLAGVARRRKNSKA